MKCPINMEKPLEFIYSETRVNYATEEEFLCDLEYTGKKINFV